MENPSKLDKLKKLGLESYTALPDKYVDKLYESFKEEFKDKTKEQPSNDKLEKTINKINDSDTKYQVLLKFVNCILNNLNRPTIIKLTEFADIDRQDIIRNENNECLNKMEREIFKYFDKKKSGWYRRNIVEHYILTFLRYACDDIGYDFTYIHKTRQKDSINKTHLFYTIK